MMATIIDKSFLQKCLNQHLTGVVSHLKLAPRERVESLLNSHSLKHSPLKSAVMMLFFENNGILQMILIRRGKNVGLHAGQIAFPGGKWEPSDISIEHTAFREIEEEIGIQHSQIELLGKLSDIYIEPSNFLITVFVGFLSKKPIYNIQKQEVDEVIEIPITELLEEKTIETKQFYIQATGQWIVAPCYQTSKADIWGATAMVISEMIDLIKILLRHC